MILGKALGGGLPLGAYIATDDVATAFEYLDFASSCGGNPLACAAGLQMIEIIQRSLLENISALGKYFLDRLNELKEHHKLIGDIRGKGLFIGLELIKDESRTPAIKEADNLKNKLKEDGILILRNESTFRIIPPLTITEEQIEHVIELIDENLYKIEK
jgi:4-aminobutyrate aminotransferase-like enzyme